MAWTPDPAKRDPPHGSRAAAHRQQLLRHKRGRVPLQSFHSEMAVSAISAFLGGSALMPSPQSSRSRASLPELPSRETPAVARRDSGSQTLSPLFPLLSTRAHFTRPATNYREIRRSRVSS